MANVIFPLLLAFGTKKMIAAGVGVIVVIGAVAFFATKKKNPDSTPPKE